VKSMEKGNNSWDKYMIRKANIMHSYTTYFYISLRYEIQNALSGLEIALIFTIQFHSYISIERLIIQKIVYSKQYDYYKGGKLKNVSEFVLL
jgi:hypothetical protein